MIIKLEDKCILERLSELKNQMHLYINWELLFGNQFPNVWKLRNKHLNYPQDKEKVRKDF